MKKTLICNLPNDALQNQYIKSYILNQYKENSEIRVLSEGVVRGERISASAKQDALLKMTIELEQAGVKIIGVDDRISRSSAESSGDRETPKSLGDLIKAMPREHDESVFNYISQEKSPFIAVVCVFHVVSWVLQDKLGDKYDIIVPVHSKTLFDLIPKDSSSETAKIIEKLYYQILSLPSIKVVDIEESSLPPREKEESKERYIDLDQIEREIMEEDPEEVLSVPESISDLGASSFSSSVAPALVSIDSLSLSSPILSLPHHEGGDHVSSVLVGESEEI
jgi:hypothetical protein